MLSIPKKVKECMKIGGAIASPLIFIISIIADAIAVTERFEGLFKFLMVISSLSVIGFSIYYIWFAKKSTLIQNQIANQSQTIDLLEREIYEGKRLTKSEAMVTFDCNKKIYLLEFKKEYQIISDSIKWFECQFYCNNTLTNASEAQAQYAANQVTWAELNVKASLCYKNSDDAEFSPPTDVLVKQVAEGNNYKRFHILYKTQAGDSLDIKKDTSIALEYSYQIPIAKWGSYLNRYVSYWGEETKVIIACSKKEKANKTELKIYRTNGNGDPVLFQDSTWKETKIGDKYAREVMLKAIPCTKFIVWWDADEVFQIAGKKLNTEIGADELQMTRY